MNFALGGEIKQVILAHIVYNNSKVNLHKNKVESEHEYFRSLG